MYKCLYIYIYNLKRSALRKVCFGFKSKLYAFLKFQVHECEFADSRECATSKYPVFSNCWSHKLKTITKHRLFVCSAKINIKIIKINNNNIVLNIQVRFLLIVKLSC